MNGTLPQSVEPSQSDRPEAGWKYLAHQRVVVRMQGHHVDVVIDVLDRVGPPVVGVEWGTREPARHCGSFDVSREW